MSKTAQMVILFGILIVIWGTSWPIMKVSLDYCPAIWFATYRLAIAAVVVFVIFAATKQLVIPKRKDVEHIISVGFFQIGLFVMLITLGLGYVAPGRSAIIAYLSPLFVTPAAVLFFHEKLSRTKIMGLILGAMGIALLFSPWELNWHDHNILLGNGLLLLSAMIWSGVMLHTRYSKWERKSHVLLPWQMLAGLVPNFIAAKILVPHPVIQWHVPFFIFGLLFCALLASVVAYWLVITITRYFSVVTSSLVLLGVPVLGLLSSAVTVGEKLTPSILVSLGLILAGLVCVTVKK